MLKLHKTNIATMDITKKVLYTVNLSNPGQYVLCKSKHSPKSIGPSSASLSPDYDHDHNVRQMTLGYYD